MIGRAIDDIFDPETRHELSALWRKYPWRSPCLLVRKASSHHFEAMSVTYNEVFSVDWSLGIWTSENVPIPMTDSMSLMRTYPVAFLHDIRQWFSVCADMCTLRHLTSEAKKYPGTEICALFSNIGADSLASVHYCRRNIDRRISNTEPSETCEIMSPQQEYATVYEDALFIQEALRCFRRYSGKTEEDHMTNPNEFTPLTTATSTGGHSLTIFPAVPQARVLTNAESPRYDPDLTIDISDEYTKVAPGTPTFGGYASPVYKPAAAPNGTFDSPIYMPSSPSCYNSPVYIATSP